MILAFGESIAILGIFGILTGCCVMIVFAAYQLARRRRLSPGLGPLTALAFLPPVAFAVRTIQIGDIEYNPLIQSKEQLVGVYSDGESSITLGQNGTYSAIGFEDISEGSWSNRDWNLTLSNSTLQEPRIVTRNGVLCIAPFYIGASDHTGVLLKKQK